MTDTRLPAYLRTNPPTGYVARILEHYPGWEEWEIEARLGRDLEGYIYTVINADKATCKIGFSQDPLTRIATVISSTRHLPKECGNRPFLWKGHILKPGTMADELDLHRAFSRWRLTGLSDKVEAPTEWYPLATPAGKWVRRAIAQLTA